MINGARYILDCLYEQEITHFFMVPGKLINPFMSCYKKEETNNPDIMPIVAAHEEGAAFMADGYARVSGKFGVCITIGGPGTTNALTPMAAAFADGYPIFLISGQISHKFQMRGALQDSAQSMFDLMAMVKPVTGVAYDVHDAELIERYMKNILNQMYGFQKLPTYLSITQDALLDEVKFSQHRSILPSSIKHRKIIDQDAVELFLSYIKNHQKIIFLVGNNARSVGVYNLLIKVAEKYRIPVATSVSGKGIFPENHELSLGCFGYMGSPRSKEAIINSNPDIIVMIGYDVTQWNTMAWHPNLIAKPYLVEINSDQSALNKYIDVDLPIVSDNDVFLKYILENGTNSFLPFIKEKQSWLDEILSNPLNYDEGNIKNTGSPIHPAFIVSKLREFFPKNTMVFVDSGAHRAFMGHYWKSYGPFDYFSTTTIGPMGWAIPAGIGGKFAKSDVPCLVVTGDGCMLMHGVEIQTAARHNLDITFVVINNSHYGQTYFNNKANISRLSSLPEHNFALFAESLGVRSLRVTSPCELEAAIEKAINYAGTFLLDIVVGHEHVVPAYDYKEQMSRLYRI
ncbi:MAG TPA: thiamine pyrophosphate-binding protein [Aquella sp.]|nr:thiamine pyrophosphate-binding protein [Aquella sp.]